MLRFAVLALLTWSGIAGATSYAPPEAHDVWSANRQFVLHVDPHTNEQRIAAAGEPATPLWSFERKVGFDSFFLADDGRTAAVVGWEFVQVDDLDEPAVELWRASGRFATHSYRSLIAQPSRVRGVGPIGGFWREWLRNASCDGDTLVVATTGPFSYAFDLSTGERDRRWSLHGVLVRLVGVVLLGLAIGLCVWTSRAARRFDSLAMQRRLWFAAISPLLALVWLALDFGIVPFVPAEVLDWVHWALIVLAAVAVPFSLINAVLLPRGSRVIRLATIVLASGALAVVRVVW